MTDGPNENAAFGIAGLCLLLPASAFDGAIWTDIAGLLLAIPLIGAEVFASRRAKAAAGE